MNLNEKNMFIYIINQVFKFFNHNAIIIVLWQENLAEVELSGQDIN